MLVPRGFPRAAGSESARSPEPGVPCPGWSCRGRSGDEAAEPGPDFLGAFCGLFPRRRLGQGSGPGLARMCMAVPAECAGAGASHGRGRHEGHRPVWTGRPAPGPGPRSLGPGGAQGRWGLRSAGTRGASPRNELRGASSGNGLVEVETVGNSCPFISWEL